ncbi:hypothetical protein EB796_000824 [Bugula neritina]|uniref:Cadherin domain-containing protein n=1 Tax=Bugula neritina TaxID=10212 RepID=A0A7J7KRL9_BUGNE|nr:hypothetical protein EB796_000824 [Bugula neritina]
MLFWKKMLSLALLAHSFVLLVSTSGLPTISLDTSKRHINSLEFKLNINDSGQAIESYEIKVEDKSSTGFITYEGDRYINLDDQIARVAVPEANQAYNICIIATLKQNASEELGVTTVTDCLEEKTIKKMLASSVIALSLTVLILLACIIIGYISWKCAAKKLYQRDEYDRSDETGSGDIIPLNQIEE